MEACLALVFLIAAAPLLIQAKHHVDYRLTPHHFNASLKEANNEIVCTTHGRVCDPDCKRLWVCMYFGNELRPAFVCTCNEEQTCNNGFCSDVPSTECSPAATLDFVCDTEGVFPNPVSCRRYYHCVKSDCGKAGEHIQAHRRDCHVNYGCNPRTTYCDKRLENNVCGGEYPVPLCHKPGEHAALRENPSIFYVCKLHENEEEGVLYLQLYLCPNGKEYDGKFGCQ